MADSSGLSGMKTCPRCAEDIEAGAAVCRFCGQGFAQVRRGYCSTCHRQVEVGVGVTCPTCGAEVMDIVDQTEPSPLPPPSGSTVVTAAPSPTRRAPPEDQPAAPRARSTRRRLALVWTFAVLMLLVGIGGFVLAAGIERENEQAYAADYAALGARDPDPQAQALDVRVAKVKAAYDAYVAALAKVHTRHEAVTEKFNEVVSPLLPDNLVGIQNAEAELPDVIADYEKAVKKEETTRQAYLKQLSLLKAEVAG